MNKETLIILDNIKKHYIQGRETIEVLQGVNLDISEPKTVCITGRSGSGKSTLINLIAGLDTPTSGKVLVLGEDISGLDDNRISELRRRNIGIVFQFHHLLPEFSAIENVMIPMLSTGMRIKEAHARAEELLKEVSLSDRMDFKPQYLSGGEQQKVAVARALANDPKIILADEPTGNLDAVNARKIFDILLKLCYTYKKLCIVVTHSIEFLQEFDEKYELKEGYLLKI